VRRTLLLALLALAVALGAPDRPRATTVVQRPLARLASAAERISHVRVVSQRVEADAQGRPWTHYTVELVDEWKRSGLSTGTRFELRQIGGVLGGRALTAVGFPYFDDGEELVLFLAPDGVAQRVLNAGQGAVRIVTGPSISGGAPARSVPSAPTLFSEARATDLASFRSLVRATLAGSAP
jgi:hypothetical protein